MGSYGRQVMQTTGRPLSIIAAGDPEWKHGGITLDWDTVTAVSGSAVTLLDGSEVAVGDKYLPAGTVLDLIGVAEIQTIDLSGDADPTGGTFTITYGGQTTAAIAYNASASAVQMALEALSNVQPGDIVVTKSSFVYTLTFGNNLGNVAQVTVGSGSLTSGGTISVAIATGTAGTGNAKYGPADTAATDGRQTLARGESYLLADSVVKSRMGSDHPPVLEGGTVWQARLQAGNTVAGALQPNLAAILTAFPRLRLVKEGN